MKHGFLRIAAARPIVRPADIEFNSGNIINLAAKLAEEKVSIAVFPELSVTGYTCADLFEQERLLTESSKALKQIVDASAEWKELCITVGIPIIANQKLYNCGAVIANGKLIGIVPKSYLPNYGEFYEKRWFAEGHGTKALAISLPFFEEIVPFGTDLLFDHAGVRFGIEICEDLWVPQPPSALLSIAGAELILNLSATDELIGKHDYLRSLISQQSARCRGAYAYSSAGSGESSTDLVFSGNCIIAENGSILAETERFRLEADYAIADIDFGAIRHDRLKYNSFTALDVPQFRILSTGVNIEESPKEETFLKYRKIWKHPFVDENPEDLEKRCNEISSIQAWGLLTRLKAIGCKTAVIGISGGLDSTLALLVTVQAFDSLKLDRKGIIAITMPGFGTSDRTKTNADKLMELLGVTALEINIGEAVNRHFKDIGHDPEIHNVTYENSQARERTQILMDIANKENGLVIGTGDLSELALGWCTYNGDQMSMYAVNASIPKTLVRYLVEGYARQTSNAELKRVLTDIVETPVSPELLPADSDGKISQKTEDLVGPYELHDFFLYEMLRHGARPVKILDMAVQAFEGEYSKGVILKWLNTFIRRFFNQQFKRSCMPDGAKVGSICLSPRGDWRMPSDATSRMWLKELEDISVANN